MAITKFANGTEIETITSSENEAKLRKEQAIWEVAEPKSEPKDFNELILVLKEKGIL